MGRKKDLEKELEELKENFNELCEKINNHILEFREKLDSYENLNTKEDISVSIDDKGKICKTNQKAYIISDETCESLKKKIREVILEKENVENLYDSQIKMLESKISKIEKDCVNLKDKIAEKNQECKKLSILYKESNKEVDSCHQKIETLTELNRGLQKDIKKQLGEYEILTTNYNKLQEEYSEIDKVLTTEKQRTNRLRKQLKERFEIGYELFTQYDELSNASRRLLEKKFHSDSFEVFIANGLRDDTLNFIYEGMKAVANEPGYESEIEVLSNMLSYFISLINKSRNEEIYRIIEPEINSSYDAHISILSDSSKAQGTVKKVVVPGLYNVFSEKIVQKSIVSLG